MDVNTMKLSDIPEIKELLKVLEENGLLKEQNDVKTLVSYIEDMETKLFDMSTELKEMHGSRAVWAEVLSVYAVKTTTDPDNAQEVATMDDSKKAILKDIFWQMNAISSRTETKTETVITETDDGHREIDNPFKIEERLEEEIYRLLGEKEYVDFLVGRDGEFDQFASSAVLRVRKQYRDDNSSLILVLPYARAEYLNNEESYHDYYSDVEISYAASKAHPKAAIQIRNREMVDRADLVICAIEKEAGGAWQTVQYAMKQEKPVINLFDEPDE